MNFVLKRYLLTLLALAGPVIALLAQPVKRSDVNRRELHWTGPVTTRFSENETRTFLWFDGAAYDASRDYLPVYNERRSVSAGTTSATAQLLNPVYQPLDPASAFVLGASASYLRTEAQVDVVVTNCREQLSANISILPLRKNPATGAVEKLVSFGLDLKTVSGGRQASVAPAFASSSVLANGTWHRIGVTATGIYKLDYNFFSNMGLDMAALNPANIRLYGNGHGQLPYSNGGQHSDDLLEYAIFVQDQNSNGVFEAGDYVLFYGISPNTWTFDTNHQHYHHNVHNYSDTTYYFITADLGPGKRIAQQASSSLTPTDTVTSFDDYQFHEFDNENLIKSGREWYGEKFDILNSYSFSFNFPNIDNTRQVCAEIDMVSRDDDSAENKYTINAQSTTDVISIPATSSSCYYCPYANPGSKQMCFTPTGPVVNVTITRQYPSATGWLNYIRVNARRHLKMNGAQMSFRDRTSMGNGNVAQYILDGYTSTLAVWDVTDLANVANQQMTPAATTLMWTLPSDSVREFIAFDGSSYLTAVNFGPVANQNLHALQPVDYIIIAHPDFLQQATQLAQLHATYDNLSYVIVTPQQIYNEFSSGMQDVTAIRDFVRMLYFRAPTQAELPKYLLLFGDGSYDNKHRMPNNTNFIPTFQNLNSIGPTESYVSDEYYGLLNDLGGWDDGGDAGAVDIGIGRLPVQSTAEANAMVAKVLQYMTRQQPVINVSPCSSQQCSKGGEWKTWISFVGDDEDSDVHMSQSDQLATFVDTTYNNYNIDKIYLDAYQQQQTPGGERYPGVNDAIDKRVDKGALIINYTGHGGEVGLAHERILEVTQINAWTNYCNMPLFVTATCEFSRFDDPARTSAGEYVLLNANGGGIGLLTTVRLVYSTPNFNLNKKFYECAFEPYNGEVPRLGDLYLQTKVNSGNNTNNRNFTLLADPAVRLNYPTNNVKTTEINSVPVSSQADTLKALSRVTVKGYVEDTLGNKLTNFNGVLYPTVFDKKKSITTLGNDPPNQPFTFLLQKSVLYHGKVSVVNGDFEFSFVVPKDISYQYGYGRISYYAEDGQTDASGSYENIIIGGSNPSAPVDATGPQVRLFLNDSNFVSGGITNASPSLFAMIRDTNGVNTVGNGIGHDVVAILDEQTDNAIVLNDYYQADMNSYQSGKIIYPFSNLSEGKHTLSLKVWDVYNNSTTVTTEFTVTNPEGLSLDHLINYPNPFTTHTSFFIEYNQCCTEYDVMIQVFTVSGKLVKTINEHVNSDGFRSEPIDWDGRDDYGDRIGRGVYIYRAYVRAVDGRSAEKYEKLVILN